MRGSTYRPRALLFDRHIVRGKYLHELPKFWQGFEVQIDASKYVSSIYYERIKFRSQLLPVQDRVHAKSPQEKGVCIQPLKLEPYRIGNYSVYVMIRGP